MARGKINTQLVIDGQNNTKKAFGEIKKQLGELEKDVSDTGRKLIELISVSALSSAAKTFLDTADTVRLMNSRLKLATSTQEEFNNAQEELNRIARETSSPIGALVTLYGRISRPLREAGRSQSDILKVTEAVATAFKVSGASAQEAENGVIQFAQALGSGALRGDEFNSVAEQAPRLMQALADGIGVPVSALRDLAKEGELTAKVVTDALVQQLPKLKEEFAQFGITVGSALQNLENSAVSAVGALDNLTGASTKAASSLNEIADALNGLASGKEIAKNINIITVEIAKLIPQLTVATVLAQKILDSAGDSAQKAAEEASSANVKYMQSLDVLEKAEVDRNIRRLSQEQEAAAKIAGVRFDEETSLRSWAKAMGETYEDFIAREQQRQKMEEAAELSHQQRKKEARESGLKDLQRDINRQLKSLEDANGRLKKARDSQATIEKEFNKLVSDIRTGSDSGSGEFGDVVDAQIRAKQAIRAGDFDLAIEEARRAGEILKSLQSAGANNYGFAGIAEQIAQIANEAARLNTESVDQDVKNVEQQLVSLQKQADALKVLSIDVRLDRSSVEQIKQDMLNLAAELSKVTVTTEVVLKKPKNDSTVTITDTTQQFSTGGHVAGPGTGTSDSILARLSNGEYVLRAEAVRHYGAALLDRMNGLALPKFADGGLVEAAMSAPVATPGRDLGRVELVADGQRFSLLADGDEFGRILSRTATKFGRTKRR